MDYHPVVYKIRGVLEENHFWFEVFEHGEVHTSKEAAKTRPGYTLGQGAKAMIISAKNNDDDKKFVMLVFPADLRFDNGKVKKALSAKNIRFASSDEINRLTGGVKIGGVPPFGNLFNIEVYADPKLFLNEKIVFNAGDRRYSIAMMSEDYKKIVNPKVEEIT
ncbi:hypothetical protein M1328_03700 [Patescibacteria group bacterium]|nr:hypothetical protein [Patescibacteria group bacterium]